MFPIYAMVMGGGAAPAPTVTSVAKTLTRTSGGILLVITGTNMTGATGADVGGTALTSFVAVNATTVQGITPAKATGTYAVNVTGPGGTGTLASAIKFVDPSSIFGANLKRWYSQSYAAGVWTDASGTANTSQSTSGKRPTATTLAGTTDRPATHVALSFDGVDDGLNAGGAGDTFTTAGVVACVVAASATQNADSNIFAKNYGNEDVILACNRGGSGNGAAFGCGGSSGTELAIASAAINDTVVRRLIGTFGSSTARLYVNGTLQADTGTGTMVTSTADFNAIGCGMYNTESTTDYHFTGKLAELVIANVTPSTGQRNELDAYLRDCAGAAT